MRGRCSCCVSRCPPKSVEYNWHDAKLSQLEAVLARGDRRIGPVLEYAMRHGARLDGWDEYFRPDIWDEAFAQCGVDISHYTTRGFAEDEPLPWQTIDVGVRQDFFLGRTPPGPGRTDHARLPHPVYRLRRQRTL